MEEIALTQFNIHYRHKNRTHLKTILDLWQDFFPDQGFPDLRFDFLFKEYHEYPLLMIWSFSVYRILPPLSKEESLEVSTIYSVAGLLPAGKALITERPFQSPHHSITTSALAGGGKERKCGSAGTAAERAGRETCSAECTGRETRSAECSGTRIPAG